MSEVQQLTDINSTMSLLAEFATSLTVEGEILVTLGQVILHHRPALTAGQGRYSLSVWCTVVYKDVLFGQHQQILCHPEILFRAGRSVRH